MSSITIPLSDDMLVKLEHLAKKHNMSPEELIQASVENLIAAPSQDFEDAMNYVLAKNKELYDRLAS